jgi:hypothetical protein
MSLLVGLWRRYERLSISDKARGTTRCRHQPTHPACADCIEKSWEYVDEGRCRRCGETRARVYEDVIFHVPMLDCQRCYEARTREPVAVSAVELPAPDEPTPVSVTSMSPRSRPSSLAERLAASGS